MHPKVVIGFLGTTLDRAQGPKRWERWRPTVDLCRHEDLAVNRLELLSQKRFASLARQVSEDIRSVSPETQVRVHDLALGDPWDFEDVYAALHEFARGYAFSENEDYLVHMTTGTHVAQICLFLLTEARYLPARMLQTSPPRRSDGAGPGSYSIIDLDLSKYDRLASRFKKEHEEGLSFLKSGIATRNAAFNALVERIERVAIASDAPILLMGPTGAGKSQLAQRIHALKKQRRQTAGRFVEVNCATLRGDAAMSALFGHLKGAFTGAMQDRPGLLRAADGGVLFLDEIGELGLDEQAMLLRAIEEKKFLPLGSEREVASDFQLIVGTNRDLRAAVSDHRFREDLLSRIDLWTFTLPGLRARREDIEPNLEYELDRWAERSGARVSFNKEARERFLQFAGDAATPWPGNFRDFNAAIVRMATLAAGGRIDVALVDEEIARLREAWRRAPAGDGDALLPRALGADAISRFDRFDVIQLEGVLAVCAQSRSLSEAGRALFGASRQKRSVTNDADRLRKYLARFDLSWADVDERLR
ncbi:MAG TPA: RNA repair transcriptional activator RtcR [Myxococcota bacterium]|jgi:transcriptional regulatory protein RtcR